MAFIKKLRKLFILAAAVLVCILAVNPVSAYATQSGERDIVITKDVILGDGDSIHIYVKAHVKYSYDEGVYGWINNVTVTDDSGVGSNDVNINILEENKNSRYGLSTYWIEYYFEGGEYSGYITLYFNCDEWGDLSGWITYTAL